MVGDIPTPGVPFNIPDYLPMFLPCLFSPSMGGVHYLPQETYHKHVVYIACLDHRASFHSSHVGTVDVHGTVSSVVPSASNDA